MQNVVITMPKNPNKDKISSPLTQEAKPISPLRPNTIYNYFQKREVKTEESSKWMTTIYRLNFETTWR